MKKALMVAYQFPPVGGAGVQRVVKFIKYLGVFGWGADAVTVLNPSVPVIDMSLLRELPPECSVFRTKTYEPSYSAKISIKTSGRGDKTLKSFFACIVKKCASYILLPDAQVLWWPHTLVLLSRLLKEKKHDVVFVSGPPFSTFFITVFIAKRYGIPVVIDYRDEWSFSRDNWENSVKTPLARLIDSWMEQYVIKYSRAITVASPYYKISLEKMFPFSSGKIKTITNGYDPKDFEKIDFDSENNRNNSSFTIVYTGTVWRATSLAPFMEGVCILSEKEPSIASQIKLRIIGRIVAEESHIIEQLKKHIQVETLNYLPHEEIFPEIVSADLLLLTLSDLDGAGKIIPGKTFEYLAAPIPVLAVIPEGVTSEIIKNEKNVFIISPGDSNRIAEVLGTLVKNPCERTRRDGIEKYSRPYLTKQLVELFETIT